MKRKITARLEKWRKATASRLPLLLYGARQVGKTYVMQELGADCFRNTVYVNFEADHKIGSFFGNDIHAGAVIKILEKYYRDTDCMNKTYYSEDKTAAIGKMLYGSFTMDNLDIVKANDKVEYGVINFNGYSSLEAAESYIVELTYFEPPYKDGTATVYDDFAQIAFDIDNDGKITAVRWYYYPEEK